MRIKKGRRWRDRKGKRPWRIDRKKSDDVRRKIIELGVKMEDCRERKERKEGKERKERCGRGEQGELRKGKQEEKMKGKQGIVKAHVGRVGTE